MIKKKTKEPRVLPNDLVMLDDLIGACYKQLLNKMAEDAKLGDFLKMVEMRAKMAPSELDQAKFWKMLDKIRATTLAENKPAKRTASRSAKQTPARKGK